ncbi:hypothetical protein C7W88_18905 (plasmid) [Novosphingobium sp. THN1]|nr:hypothetical protein C7W88_18905 [Novosphingobium sp. THN1]
MLGAGLPALAKAGSKGVLDVTSEAGRLRNFIMMRGALDEGLITSWVSARYYGVVEDRMDPLFAVVSAVYSRYRQVADGYEAVNFELAWFTDPVTGKALETWDNPYTGKTCKVPTGACRRRRSASAGISRSTSRAKSPACRWSTTSCPSTCAAMTCGSPNDRAPR